jgi:RimJ/RimL family protein N-acetyltransferase
VARRATIETERLRLRPCTPDDADALHRLWTDPDVRRHLWDDEVISAERAGATLAAGIASFADAGYGLWAVLPRDADRLIGFCGLRAVPATGDVELVYGMAPACWGRGLASEAVVAVLDFAFAALGLGRVIGVTDPPNAASIRVMEKAGMQPDPDRDPAVVRYVAQRGTWRRHPA